MDKTRLHSWLFKSDVLRGEEGLVVLFHGNAQNLSSHYLSVSWLTRFGYDVWVWDYRGYGLSQGKATSEGIAQDASAALQFAMKLYQKKSYKKLILVGQSLGGNILTRALSDFNDQKKVSLLVLDSTFLSYRKIAKNRLQSVWFLYPISFLSSLLVTDKYSGENSINKLNIPTLVIHGKLDPVIPFSFGEEVYKELKTKKKEFWQVPEGKHINTLGNGKRADEEKFLKLILKLSGNSSS
ncbi:MAG: alpha/beta hydrolase [Bacteriovoracaceae bacterium]|nr:alpha/beta hydrolase [Bacteriovoracaceae bacterium]